MAYNIVDIQMMFQEEAANVWKNYNYPLVEVKFKNRTKNNDPLMSIIAGHRDYRTKAIGLNLLWKPVKIKLTVTDDALSMDESSIRALLRHEALHIGYPRHDDDFKFYVKKINAPLTEYELVGGVKELLLQEKIGSRFKTIRSFDYDALGEAREYARKYREENNNVGKLRFQRRM